MNAISRLIDFYYLGRGGEQDLDRARLWIDRACSRNPFVYAPLLVKVLIEQQRYTEAFRILDMLRRGPFLAPNVAERLSLLYEHGWGVEKNPELAEYFLNYALSRGDARAIFRRALQDLAAGQRDKALDGLRRAAHQLPEANTYLGRMYYEGNQVPGDTMRGLQYLRAAVDQNDRDALNYLARLALTHGVGAPLLGEALDDAIRAEQMGQPDAAATREALEKLRDQDRDKSAQTTETRST
jgi:TPR repeat protein